MFKLQFCLTNITQLYWGKSFAWQHVHTHPYFFDSLKSPLSLTLFFVITLSYSSPSWWHHFCPAISILNWIFHHIFFMYVWSYVWIFVIFLIFLYLFICHLLICNILFFWFLLLHFLRKFRLNYTHELYIHTLLIIVAYFVNTFYCINVMFLHEIFSVFQLTFSCFHHNVHLYTFIW